MNGFVRQQACLQNAAERDQVGIPAYPAHQMADGGWIEGRDQHFLGKFLAAAAGSAGFRERAHDDVPTIVREGVLQDVPGTRRAEGPDREIEPVVLCALTMPRHRGLRLIGAALDRQREAGGGRALPSELGSY